MDNSFTEHKQDEQLEPDPIFVTGLAEGKWILLMWLGCLVWTMSVCSQSAYETDIDPGTFPTVFGIPAWVVWGICLPWMIANLVTWWFCFFHMKDGDLGDGVSETQASAGDASNA